jgi:hypothetical protein
MNHRIAQLQAELGFDFDADGLHSALTDEPMIDDLEDAYLVMVAMCLCVGVTFFAGLAWMELHPDWRPTILWLISCIGGLTSNILLGAK